MTLLRTITKAQAAEFARALKQLESEPAADLHPKLREAQIAAVRSQYADLEAELQELDVCGCKSIALSNAAAHFGQDCKCNYHKL